MGVGCHWGWEAADSAEGDSLKVMDCLGKVALFALMVGAHWGSKLGVQVVHLLDLFAAQA
jgi:hypothetical protein